ncbi:M48 family metallopeptidase [Chitiniphilus purpureus]|uniref:M48 family metallopeptidase n=1 Tax=Chitiniphilus purpureus TaxID=2981137 RepID=A0ABY6DIM4_9NEIS|nr:M48 family metallopeptidase [Chitiniphilus sp. CD1]UXY14197.1 M48 family metallopeptidase [Chitiniphilus sp. CD1]
MTGGIPARYFDGRSSSAQAVTLRRDGTMLRMDGLALPQRYRLGEVILEPRLGRQPRRLQLPDGGLCECDDHAGLATILARREERLFRLEQHWRFSLYAVLILVIGVGAAYLWGLPLAARGAATLTPAGLERALGEHSFSSLEQSGIALKPSRVSPARQAVLRRAFAGLVPPDSRHRYVLHLRDAGTLGANAFALPGGVVVLTDQLAAIASDQEVAAVLAHEIGHVEHQHGLRMLYQSAGIGLALAALLGDAPSAATTVVGMGSMLLELGYSRDAEREADAFAQAQLARNGLPPRLLASALRKLAQAHAGAEVPALLSSHPDTAERIEALSR